MMAKHTDRDFVRDELERLHELMSWPRVVLLLEDIEKNFNRGNNWKLAARHRVSIHDLRAIRHWLFEERFVVKGRVKRLVRAKIRAVSRVSKKNT